VESPLKIGTRVFLELASESGPGEETQVLTLSSVIADVPDEEHLLLLMPMHRGSFYPLPKNVPLLMKFVVAAGMYTLKLVFEGREGHGPLSYAKMRAVGEIEEHQMRDCFRLSCNIPATVRRAWLSEFKGEPDDLPVPVSAKILDISDGGALVATDEHFESGEKFTVSFSIGTDESLECVALRISEQVGAQFRFRVGVQFQNMPQRQKDRIFRFITLEQRNRKKTK
jgi:c-di-GMP-binding flagellar brake protein YcgR